MKFLEHLAKKNCDAVGFLPTPAVEHYIEAGGASVVLENGEPAGMLITRDGLAACPTIRPILQAAVCYDARRRHLGLALVEQLQADAIAAGRAVLQLKCREELPAVLFWQAAGFELVGTQPAGTRRGGRVLVMAKQIGTITPADLILKTVERNRGPGGFYSKTPLVITPAGGLTAAVDRLSAIARAA